MMLEEASNELSFVIRGRSNGDASSPATHWEYDCRVLVYGRLETLGRPFTGRVELGSDIVRGLSKLAKDRRIELSTFRALVYDVLHIFYFLDYIDAATLSGKVSAGTATFSGGVQNLPGAIWLLFIEWLPGQLDGPTLSRVCGQCTRVVTQAAIAKYGRLPDNFILPPNRFKQRKSIENWDREDDLDEDEDYRKIGLALINQVKIATERLSAGRQLIPEVLNRLPPDGLPACMSRPIGPELDDDNDDYTERDLYAHLCEHLIEHRYLFKSAIIDLRSPYFIDKYANELNF